MEKAGLKSCASTTILELALATIAQEKTDHQELRLLF